MIAAQPMRGREVDAGSMMVERLDALVPLRDEDRRLAASFFAGTVRELRARQDAVRQGEVLQRVLLILDGWAAVVKTLGDGRRQMIAVLMPGDIYAINPFHSEESDHAVTALGALSVLEMRRDRIRHVIDENPRIAAAFWCHGIRAAAIDREWIVNLGQRSAVERIAHLFCEIYARLRAVGRAANGRCELPMTQTDLGEATGLTSVHVNRTLQQMRADQLIHFAGRELTIKNLDRLVRIAMFNGRYLNQPPLTSN